MDEAKRSKVPVFFAASILGAAVFLFVATLNIK